MQGTGLVNGRMDGDLTAAVTSPPLSEGLVLSLSATEHKVTSESGRSSQLQGLAEPS